MSVDSQRFGEVTVEIPVLLGSRASAAELVDESVTPYFIAVTFDFAQNVSSSQGACDELVKSIEGLGIQEIHVKGASDRVRQHLMTANHLRRNGALVFD